jgi:tetratricopeptide (TPR) repeat protein
MNNYKLTCVVFILLPCLITSAFGDESDELRQAQDALAKSFPALQKLSQAHPDDAEILIGIANLIQGNSHYLGSLEASSVREQYERILAADPDNRLANAVLARMRTSRYIGKTSLLRELADKIDNAKRRGLDRLRLEINSDFAEYLKDHAEEVKITPQPGRHRIGPSVYLLIDFDIAKKVLHQKLEAEAVPVLKMLDDTETKDPNNATYDYLRARIYLQLGNTEAVLAAMEKAAQKKYVKQYVHEAEQAESRVLDEIDFPQNLRKYIAGARLSFGAYIYDIWRTDDSIAAPEKGLSDIAAEFEDQGNFEKAENIYRQIIKAGEQCIPEQYGAQSTLIDRGQERIDALHARMHPRGPRVLLYAGVAGICLCVLAITLSLRRRAKKISPN